MDYEITLVAYITDKYRAETRREIKIKVFPAVLQDSGGDGAADLAAALLDSAVDMAMNTGDLSMAGQATAATVDLLNDNGNETLTPDAQPDQSMRRYRRVLQEYQESPAGQNRSGLRDRMMDIAGSVSGGSPDTDVSRRSSFQMTGSLTAAPGEVGAGLTDKGAGLVAGTLSGGNPMDPDSGSDATGALSNLLFTADLSSAKPDKDAEDLENDSEYELLNGTETPPPLSSPSPPSTLRRRRRPAAGRRRLVESDATSSNYTANSSHPRNLSTVTGESFCGVTCGYTLNQTFISRGSCQVGVQLRAAGNGTDQVRTIANDVWEAVTQADGTVVMDVNVRHDQLDALQSLPGVQLKEAIPRLHAKMTCSCDAYQCDAANCVSSYVSKEPGGCYTAEDRCVGDTCVSVQCQPGVCADDQANCTIGRCVDLGSHATIACTFYLSDVCRSFVSLEFSCAGASLVKMTPLNVSKGGVLLMRR